MIVSPQTDSTAQNVPSSIFEITQNYETISCRSSRAREFRDSSRAKEITICFFRRTLISCLSENFDSVRKRTFGPWSVSGGCFFTRRVPEGAHNQSHDLCIHPLIVHMYVALKSHWCQKGLTKVVKGLRTANMQRQTTAVV